MMALIRGGLLYYAVIFSVNFILAIMILVAKVGFLSFVVSRVYVLNALPAAAA